MNEHIRKIADWNFGQSQEGLEGRLLQRLARIDVKHVKKGLYNSTVRLSHRRVAQRECLERMLHARIASVVAAYEQVGRVLDRDANRYLAAEVYRIIEEWKRQLFKDAETEMAKTQLGRNASVSIVAAIDRDIWHEHNRAMGFLESEKARHTLLAEQADPSLGRQRAIDPRIADLERARQTIEMLRRQSEAKEQAGKPATPTEESIKAAAVRSEDSLSWTAVKEMTMRMEPALGRRWPDLVLSIPRGEGTEPIEVRIRGRSRPHLARLVIEQPNQTHQWSDLLAAGWKRGYWKAADPANLAHTGRLIRAALPPSLRGHWQQSGAAVCWTT